MNMLNREMLQYTEDESFGKKGEKDDGWALWRKARLYEEMNKYVCTFQNGGYGSIEGSNKGGAYYFSNEQSCNHSDQYLPPSGNKHPERLNLAELNFMGKDENGEIVIGKHPERYYSDRNPNFVFIQIAQAVVAKRNTNLINVNYGPANIKPEFYEKVSELVGEMSVQIASEYKGDYV